MAKSKKKYTIPCPHCNGAAQYHSTSTHIYGKNYGAVYHCLPCDAYVGVHKGTHDAKGSPATKEWREARKKAHAAFDPIWQSNLLTRSEAYKLLSNAINIPLEKCHIGMFNPEQCHKVVEASNILQLEMSKKENNDKK